MGIAQNLKEENVIVARNVGATSVQSSHGQATSQALFLGSSGTTVRQLCIKLTWDMLVARERNTNWNAWRMLGAFWEAIVNFDFLCDFSMQRYKMCCSLVEALFEGQIGSFTSNELSFLKRDRTDPAPLTLCFDEEELGQ